MDWGKDSYTTPTAVQTYLDRTLSASELTILSYVIPAVSRWIDRSLGTIFDYLPTNVPFGTVGSGWTQKYFGGGSQEIDIQPCQQIIKVEAINPYDLTVWYTYSTPLEFMAEPYNLPVKRSMRMRANEFTGYDLRWPGDNQGIRVTALFTEYDYTLNNGAGGYPTDIVLLANHIAGVWLQNNQNTTNTSREEVEGHLVVSRLDDMLASDPMVTRVLQSRGEIWLEA